MYRIPAPKHVSFRKYSNLNFRVFTVRDTKTGMLSHWKKSLVLIFLHWFWWSFTVHYNYTKIGRFLPILSITICFKLFLSAHFSFFSFLKCFQNHCQFLKSQKQTKAFFKVSWRFFLVLNWTTNSWRGIETSFARDNEKARKSCEYGPENGKQKFNQTRRRSNNWYVFTFQSTHLTLIVMLNFQYFRLDTSFLLVSSKWFGNLRKYIDKRLVNSVIRDSCDIGFRLQFNAEFPKLSL